MKEPYKPPTTETLFNMGLSNQMLVHELFQQSSHCSLFGELSIRGSALLSVKRIVISECNKDEQKIFDKFETDIKPLQIRFHNTITKYNIHVNPDTMSWVIPSGQGEFSKVHRELQDKLDDFEEKLRIKLQPLLFPKGDDRRFALSGR